MKLILLYLLRALGVSIAIAVVGTLLSFKFYYSDAFSKSRMTFFFVMAFVFFVLQLVTMPLIVLRRRAQNPGVVLTAQAVHDEQFRLLRQVSDWEKRHRTKVVIGLVLVLIVIVVVDSFR